MTEFENQMLHRPPSITCPFYAQRSKKTHRSRFSIWLDAHPGIPQDYEPGLPLTRKSNKKDSANGNDNVPRARYTPGGKRRKLEGSAREGGFTTRARLRGFEHASANIMPKQTLQEKQAVVKEKTDLTKQLPRRSSRSCATEQVPSSSPTSGNDGEGNEELKQVTSDEDDFDESVTQDPTRKSSAWVDAPDFFPLPAATTTSSKRSASPSKSGDLQLSDIQLRFMEGESVPAQGLTLWNDMKRIGRGSKASASIIREKVRQSLSIDHDDIDRYLYPAVEGKGKKKAGDSAEYMEIWKMAEEIKREALRYRNKSLVEPAWNSRVHDKLLDLAIYGEWASKGIDIHDVSTARTRDKSLMDTKMQSRISGLLSGP